MVRPLENLCGGQQLGFFAKGKVDLLTCDFVDRQFFTIGTFGNAQVRNVNVVLLPIMIHLDIVGNQSRWPSSFGGTQHVAEQVI